MNFECELFQKMFKKMVMAICLGHVSVSLCDVNGIKPTELRLSDSWTSLKATDRRSRKKKSGHLRKLNWEIPGRACGQTSLKASPLCV